MEDDVDMKKIAVVTGASSGLGREFALQIARHYKTVQEIWIIARRTDRLDDLKKKIKEISDKTVRVLTLDLSKQSDIDFYKKLLERQHAGIRVLVNAAGFGVMGHVDKISYEDSVDMVDLNCRALIAMTHISLPYMTYPSNIINMASSAAFMPQPSFAVYAATKSLVLSFSRALNQEMAGKGVTVTAVCPGPVDTEFFDRAQVYAQMIPVKKYFLVKPEDVVRKALTDAYHGKEMSVYGAAMNAFRGLTSVIPTSVILKFFN